jgi:rod shape-determining protein MreD
MIRNIVWTVILAVIAGLLQSTVLGRIAILNVVPDLALCIVIFSAYVHGTMTGQVSGFFSGLLLDFISASPLGLNCLVRTLIGALTGLFKGAFFLDIFIMPVILCALGTVAKAIILLIISLFMGSAVHIYSITSSVFWIEMGLNAISAPLLFLILKRIPLLTPVRS